MTTKERLRRTLFLSKLTKKSFSSSVAKRQKDEKKEKKKEKRDRSRSPHKERERSPKRDRHPEKVYNETIRLTR